MLSLVTPFHTITMCKVLLALNIIIYASFNTVKAENNRTFPEGFLIGVGTAAYQIEGAWNEEGKGVNIWDHWVHTDPSRIKDNSTADTTADSYHNVRSDVIRAADMGATHYRFSIPWSRILPTGANTSVNARAVIHYQDLISAVIYNNMTPVATLYYNDLPQPLQDIGGWLNLDMIDHFVGYARVCFQYFPTVQYWITFNDPKTVCRLGYGVGAHAPGIATDGVGDYLCSYIVLKAHAAVYHMYQERFPALNAKLSIAIDMEWSEPASSSPADAEAAERRNLFEFGIYGHPIFIGNWPQVVIDRVGHRSENEEAEGSRLPVFTQEEVNYIRGTADFMAVNIYSTRLVADVDEPEYGRPSYAKDMKVHESLDPSWTVAPDGNAIVPWGAKKSLNWLKTTYNDPEIFITENGVADEGDTTDDIRITFLTDYLLAILDAMYEDKVKVFGYTARSLLDGFEWTDGHSQRFGFYHVDFSSTPRYRTPKDSVDFYYELTSTLRIPDSPTTPTIPTTTITPTTEESAGNRIGLHSSLIIFAYYLCFLLI